MNIGSPSGLPWLGGREQRQDALPLGQAETESQRAKRSFVADRCGSAEQARRKPDSLRTAKKNNRYGTYGVSEPLGVYSMRNQSDNAHAMI